MTQTRETGPSGGVDLVPGLAPPVRLHVNRSAAELCELAVSRGEGRLTDMGAFAAVTQPHTGRSPRDRFIVRDPLTDATVDWGAHNQPCTPQGARRLREDLLDHLGAGEICVHDARAGAHPEHGVTVRLVTESAWHAMFAHNMFLRLQPAERAGFVPGFTILHAPTMRASPSRHDTASETAIVTDFTRREVLIAGTRYAGEIKKSVFAVLNFLLPDEGVLPMHCSANVGMERGEDVALFFGLSGTGKTTLSADAARRLIGDDEHGWASDGIFNFEGGCYAKAIDLSAETEPEIFDACRRFGTILENVVLDDARAVDFGDRTITENTRASYPVHHIRNAVEPSRAGHPQNVVFLTADAFGVLPPISRLTPRQAIYHFLSGYTAKVAGTERGVTKPTATFSACFGAPFMPRSPFRYAEMLGALLHRHETRVWLINTGWTGGGFGTGNRIALPLTRAMLNAAIAGELEGAGFRKDPVFGVAVPRGVSGVPAEVLDPRRTWTSATAYDAAANRLTAMFHENFASLGGSVSEAVARAGPVRR